MYFECAIACNYAVNLLRMVTPAAGFCGNTRSGISWCHPLLCDDFAAVTYLGENYIQMRMETQPQISGVFGRIMVSQHKMVSTQNGATQGNPPFPPTLATPLQLRSSPRECLPYRCNHKSCAITFNAVSLKSKFQDKKSDLKFEIWSIVPNFMMPNGRDTFLF